jgi:hypothetical protein
MLKRVQYAEKGGTLSSHFTTTESLSCLESLSLKVLESDELVYFENHRIKIPVMHPFIRDQFPLG